MKVKRRRRKRDTFELLQKVLKKMGMLDLMKKG